MRVTACLLEQPPFGPDAAVLRQRTDRALISHWRGRADYTVLDTSFDFGGNFLAAWQAWRDCTERPERLHYVALVPRFHSGTALETMHGRWPQWTALSQALRACWPCAVPGMHRILLPDAGVRLTLVLGDAQDRQDLAQLEARVDSFLPNDDFFRRDARLLRHDLMWISRLAAFESQIIMPDGAIDEPALRAVGFMPDAGLATFAPRWQVVPQADVLRRAIVVGAGLAGAAVAQRLCARGWHVELIERHATPAREASGNLAGIFMPVLARDDNPSARFSRAAFLFALRLWQQLGGVGTAFDGAQCGVLQLLDEDGQTLSNDYPEEFARLLENGWLFAQGGWADPASVCRAMLDACDGKLTRRHDMAAARIERGDDLWRIFDEQGVLLAQAPHLVLANGAGGNRFKQTQQLPLTQIRGQVTHVDASRLPELPMAICGDGYITPAWHGLCSVGATYDIDDDASLRADSQRENLARLTRLLPDHAASVDDLPLQGRTGFRSVAPDRMPLVGAVPDYAALAISRAERLRDVPRHAGLYALLGLASRGLTWAPLAAELLAAQMSNEPLPLERDLYATLDPARFALQKHRAANKSRN
jgi:tRNA 5-methylaminomethyl-2-thiouridine biosynthesis bifunctional protein